MPILYVIRVGLAQLGARSYLEQEGILLLHRKTRTKVLDHLEGDGELQDLLELARDVQCED